MNQSQISTLKNIDFNASAGHGLNSLTLKSIGLKVINFGCIIPYLLPVVSLSSPAFRATLKVVFKKQ